MANIEKHEQNVNLISIDTMKLKKPEFYGLEIKNTDELTEVCNFQERELIEMVNYQKIGKIDRNNLIDMVFIVVSNSLRAIASKMHKDDILLLVNDFVVELHSDFKTLSIKEFEYIVKNGIRKQFDTENNRTIGLSIVNFWSWYSAYERKKNQLSISISRKIKKLNEDKQLNASPVTKRSVEKLCLNLIKEAFIEFEKKPLEDDFYSYWNKKGLIISGAYIYEQLIKFELLKEKNVLTAIAVQSKNFHAPKSLKEIASDEYLEVKRKLACGFCYRLFLLKEGDKLKTYETDPEILKSGHPKSFKADNKNAKQDDRKRTSKK
jgi:hypothetical protein